MRSSLTRLLKQNFGVRHGPYNPYRFNNHLVPRNLPSNRQMLETVQRNRTRPLPPVRNMRHVNPVRQSGPLPAYSGTYTMEDIKKVFDGTCVGFDFNYIQMDVDEVMRRVPGISRREVEHIVKLGLTPIQQVDYAYLAYNIGLDVFYMTNQMYVARQVVTNSKGQKVEVMWNGQAWEDLSTLSVGFAPILENIDYHWEIFLWSDPPLKVTTDLDLGVPATWFEYELELSTAALIILDQMNLPEDIRRFPTARNPHCRTELWKSQEQLEMEQQMEDPEYKIPDRSEK